VSHAFTAAMRRVVKRVVAEPFSGLLEALPATQDCGREALNRARIQTDLRNRAIARSIAAASSFAAAVAAW
jgi:hypothetical protein